MKRSESYTERFARLAPQTLVPALPAESQGFLRRTAETYRLTFQELRKLALAARDLEMWREQSLESWWSTAEQEVVETGRDRKQALLGRLELHLEELTKSAKVYPSPPLAGLARQPHRVVESDGPATILGRCPAYSDKTVCCGLYTLDAATGCAFSCTYCSIKTFYGDKIELITDLGERLQEVELDRDRFYHIGTGQASDSLVWGNRHGTLDALCQFAARHPNVLLELKTKADNIDYLLRRDLPANLVCSWSLNTDTVIQNEEHGTASLAGRLRAAHKLARRGCRIAFHFHPLVTYRGWREEYGSLAGRLLAEFSPEQVAYVSMGSMTFIRPVMREIRRLGGESKVLQMPMVPDPLGKLTYPDEIKIELYRCVHQTLRPWWDKVFFYLCMEPQPIWQAVLGRSYSSNEEFERDFSRLLTGWGHDGIVSPRAAHSHRRRAVVT